MNTQEQNLQFKRCQEMNLKLISALGNLLTLGKIHAKNKWAKVYAENVLREAFEAIVVYNHDLAKDSAKTIDLYHDLAKAHAEVIAFYNHDHAKISAKTINLKGVYNHDLAKIS